LWHAGNADEALSRLEARVKADPHDGRAPYLIAKIHANRLQLGAAEQWIEVALQRAPLLAPAHYLHGLILQESDRPNEALAALRRSVYAEPQFALGHFALASLLSRLGQRERAQKALDNVVTALAGRQRDEPVAEGDGMTVGQLLDLVAIQRRV
jgi:tetratricopeptide (TPR) repeat protein